MLREDGTRIPIDPCNPKHHKYETEWMGAYVQHGGTTHSGVFTPDCDKPVTSCPSPSVPTPSTPSSKHTDSPPPAQLVITVFDPDGKPVVDATLTANQLSKQSNFQGVADFGKVDPGTYQVAAEKQGYTPWGPFPNTATVAPGQKTTAQLGLMPCVVYRLNGKPLLIATGSEGLLPPITTIDIPGSVGGTLKLDFGQDTTSGTAGSLPAGVEVGTTEADLKKTMSVLLEDFAWDDADKKAEKEYAAFQSKKNKPEIYTDANLDKAVPLSPNFKDYPSRVLAAPPIVPPAGKIRIHQALEKAGWDINKVAPITDLGVPALNAGDNPGLIEKSTEDRATGLFTLINSVTHVCVFVEAYEFDFCKQEYTIKIVIELYDSFGLDDDDISKFGYRARSAAKNLTSDAKAITAWWQLQHQFGYAPLITKVVVRPAPFKVSTK